MRNDLPIIGLVQTHYVIQTHPLWQVEFVCSVEPQDSIEITRWPETKPGCRSPAEWNFSLPVKVILPLGETVSVTELLQAAVGDAVP